MERVHKQQRGFLRSKVAKTFSRVAKRSLPAQNGSSINKVRPTLTPSSNINGSVCYLTEQDQLSNPSSLQKMSTRNSTSTSTKLNSHPDQYSYVYESYDHYGGGDENVDMAAAKYILYVQERFQQD